MSTSLLDPPPHISPQIVLHMSQQAPRVLQSSPTSSLPWPISLLLSSETPETWMIHENLLLSCLQTGDDKSARLCLDRMTARFGGENERVMALKGMYEEAVAVDKTGLEKVLKEYQSILKADPTNMVSLIYAWMLRIVILTILSRSENDGWRFFGQCHALQMLLLRSSNYLMPRPRMLKLGPSYQIFTLRKTCMRKPYIA